MARAPGIAQSPPRGVGTLAENSGWAASLGLAEALGLVLAQAQVFDSLSVRLSVRPSHGNLSTRKKSPKLGKNTQKNEFLAS